VILKAAYRLTLAPGEGRWVDADMHDWTRRVMDHLEERTGDCNWVAWAHRDHSNHDHVHVIAVLERRLDRDDLRDLREHADDRGSANGSGAWILSKPNSAASAITIWSGMS
jgi:hypothetical protein